MGGHRGDGGRRRCGRAGGRDPADRDFGSGPAGLLGWAGLSAVLVWLVLGFGVGAALGERAVVAGCAVGGVLAGLPLLLAGSAGRRPGGGRRRGGGGGDLRAAAWYALTTSGFTGLDDQVLAGRPSRRSTVLRTVDDAYRSLDWSTFGTAVALSGTATWLIASSDPWAQALGLAVVTVVALRTRAFPLGLQQVPLVAAALVHHRLGAEPFAEPCFLWWLLCWCFCWRGGVGVGVLLASPRVRLRRWGFAGGGLVSRCCFAAGRVRGVRRFGGGLCLLVLGLAPLAVAVRQLFVASSSAGLSSACCAFAAGCWVGCRSRWWGGPSSASLAFAGARWRVVLASCAADWSSRLLLFLLSSCFFAAVRPFYRFCCSVGLASSFASFRFGHPGSGAVRLRSLSFLRLVRSLLLRLVLCWGVRSAAVVLVELLGLVLAVLVWWRGRLASPPFSLFLRWGRGWRRALVLIFSLSRARRVAAGCAGLGRLVLRCCRFTVFRRARLLSCFSCRPPSGWRLTSSFLAVDPWPGGRSRRRSPRCRLSTRLVHRPTRITVPLQPAEPSRLAAPPTMTDGQVGGARSRPCCR